MISRAPDAASAQRFDLAVLGGGIHGVCVALQAAERGARVLLLERSDFGSGASGNSLRVIHGGLRYLQHVDVARFRESVRERRWYARVFPQLLGRLSCVMPLYGEGTRRRWLMRAALTVNDTLSRDRNAGVEDRLRLPPSTTFGPADMRRLFSRVRPAGLQGGAQWYDYQMRSSERILTELLHAACAAGVRALNYCEVQRLLVADQRIRGLEAADRVDGRGYAFEVDRICNCTGAQARAFAAAHDRDQPQLFIPSLAFNVLLDCEPLSEHALAVAAPEAGAPVYFLCPTPFGIWAGTEHVGRPEACHEAVVSDAEVAAFLGRINRAIPRLQLSPNNVRRVYAGLLPVHTPGGRDLTSRESFIDHGKRGGAQGFFSLTGMKFTTARAVAARAVGRMLPHTRAAAATDAQPPRRSLSAATALLLDGEKASAMSPAEATQFIRETAAAESVVYAEDFFLRRTNWVFSAAHPEALERLVAGALRVPAAARSGECAVAAVHDGRRQ